MLTNGAQHAARKECEAEWLGDTWVRAQASTYTLSWWTVDGGGGTLSGGGYTLSSTAEQSDAATSTCS